MKAMAIGVALALLAAGCLTAVQKAPAQDVSDAAAPDEGSDPGVSWDVPGDSAQPADTSGDPGTPDEVIIPTDGAVSDQAQPDDVVPIDIAPEEVEPDCGFQITSFAVQDDRTHLRVGETAHVTATTNPATSVTLSFTADGVPDGAVFSDDGNGTCHLVVNDQTIKSRTAAVTITLHAKRLDCEDVRSVSVKVVGTVWATEIDRDVVQVFRSDGKFLAQGIPSGKTDDPWSLLELGPGRILVGSRHQVEAEVYDLDQDYLYPFDTKDGDGNDLYSSIYGAFTAIRHQPDGLVWVGGPPDRIIAYADDGVADKGRYKATLYLDTGDLNSTTRESLVQFGNGKTAVVNAMSAPWSMFLLAANGDLDQASYGDNSDELKLIVRQAALAGAGDMLAVGGYIQQSGYVAILNQGGTKVKASAPFPDFIPQFGIVAFGEGFLAATDYENGKIVDSLVYLDSDLVPQEDPVFSGTKTGAYRGLMVLGGN